MGLGAVGVRCLVVVVVLVGHGVTGQEGACVRGCFSPAAVRLLALADGAVLAGGTPCEPARVGKLDDLGNSAREAELEGLGLVGKSGRFLHGAGPAESSGLLGDSPGSPEVAVGGSYPAGGAGRAVGQPPHDAVDCVQRVQVRQLPVRGGHNAIGHVLAVGAVGGLPGGDRASEGVRSVRHVTFEPEHFVVGGFPIGRVPQGHDVAPVVGVVQGGFHVTRILVTCLIDKFSCRFG